MATKREELRDVVDQSALDGDRRVSAPRSAGELLDGLSLARTDGGCLARAYPDEPLFILRAQDVFAPGLVRRWAAAVSRSRTRREKVDEADALADAMEAWQAEHGSKVPD